jgi:predicted ATP-grasp superfamily ATP-dependent carboligase
MRHLLSSWRHNQQEMGWVRDNGGSSLLRGIDYFPSGSVIDGLAAALLGRCQVKNIKGTLCVSEKF